jgi:hypothetical protein
MAIALDAGIARRTLVNEILPTMETLGWLDIQRDRDQQILAVSERIPPLPILFGSADRILALALPEPVEQAVLAILRESAQLPLTKRQALEIGTAESSENDTTRALDYLEALHLIAITKTDDGTVVVYNPNIWAVDNKIASAALRAEDSNVRAALSGLIEEVLSQPGFPEDSVTSTTQAWVNYAVAQGLLQRSVVVTSEGKERAFLFSPHMGRSAFDAPTGEDPSGHVRQLIGSMVYAKNYAEYKLRSPAVFLRRLIEWGEAGDASSIGSDYPMLETAGIVRVEPADRYFKLVLLQGDIAEQALTHLESGASVDPDGTQAAGLRDQRRYVHPERERAKARVELGKIAETKLNETRRLLSALRDTAAGRRYD